jgi:hypothetical protein
MEMPKMNKYWWGIFQCCRLVKGFITTSMQEKEEVY